METFENIGLESLKDIELFKALNLEKADLANAQRYNLFRDVADFFKNKNDVSFWINKVTQGKNVDKLEQVWGYTRLLERKSQISKQMDEISDELEELEYKFDTGQIKPDEAERFSNLSEEYTGYYDSLISTKEEIEFYEN